MKWFVTCISVFFLFIGVATADPKLLVVDWPFATKQGGMTVLSARNEPYPQGLVDKADKVHLPVYMPSGYVYQINIQMVGEGDFYTVTIPLSQATVFMAGDRTYQQNSNDAGSVNEGINDVSFIRAEGMVNADFNRHGVNYTLSIECDQPDDDSRCTQTDFLQQVYADLVMIGGQP